jgi:nucleoid DNA-binding protein
VALGAWLATWSISSAVKGGAETAKSGAAVSTGGASLSDPLAYGVDTLLRPNESASAKNAAADTSPRADASQRDLATLLATSANNGSLSNDDRARVARVVASRGGLQQADAEKRVDGVFTQVKSAADKVRDANDAARKAGLVVVFALAPNAAAPAAESSGQGVDKAAFVEGVPTEASRQEVSRILLSGGADESLSTDDHAYLVRLVAARTGISQADAEKRVDGLIEQTKATADKARKAGILLAFLTTASLVLGAAAAWWGAGVGGRHRDEKFVY